MPNLRERSMQEVLSDEMVMHDPIRKALAEGPKTIPEIAEAVGSPAWEVTVWVMAMLRYGKLHEMPKGRADDYFQYKLAE